MVNAAVQAPGFDIISKHGFAEVTGSLLTGQKALLAAIGFKMNEVICAFSAANVYEQPNYLTVQKGLRQHITLQPEFLQYTNHSCAPNVFFDTEAMELIAIRDIERHEEFSFFYPSTEYDMAQPFICYCGESCCLENIRGAKYLSPQILDQYRLTKFIQQQIQTNP